MRANAALENTFGTIGTILWSGQIIPQVWKSYREKSTHGLSPWLMFLWATSAVFLGVYAIVQNINIPIILQPQLFGALAALSWIQCLYYDGRRSRAFCVSLYAGYLAVFAGFEAGMTFVTRTVIKHGDNKLLHFFGVFSGVLICVALIPQFVEIYKLKEVRGISLLFMAVDIAGGVFSLLSLAFKEHMDYIAAISYLGVIILDSVIVILAFILNPRAKRRRKEEIVNFNETGQTPSTGLTTRTTDNA